VNNTFFSYATVQQLNVWTALLTLELKYGTNNTLQDTVDHACRHNNPKQVYLRVCELLDKEVDAAASATGSSDLHTSTKRADEMFKKMCKKFKNKRSLLSLCQTKHVEVMSKFAQMEFELGSPERGRTIFNALLQKHPKRMDLLFVCIDKEVKIGDITKARYLFDSVVHPVSSDRKFKFSDKQMKSLFKKWYRMEEEHGDAESQDHVKDEARAFVAKSNS
jgi:rRNA biogenesis protein RRP5